MTAYIARRILLMVPTLLGILFVSFIVVQFAPGGPVERVIAQLSDDDGGSAEAIWFGRRFVERRLQAGDEVLALVTSDSEEAVKSLLIGP